MLRNISSQLKMLFILKRIHSSLVTKTVVLLLGRKFKRQPFYLYSVRKKSYDPCYIPPQYRENPPGSRYHPLSYIEQAEEVVKELLLNNTPQSSDEWHQVKIQVLERNSCLSEISFSGFMMNCLLKMDNISNAHSFMQYLVDFNFEVTYLTNLKYMDICGKNVDKCGQELILRTFRKLKPYADALPVMDFKSAEHLLHGICETDQWRLGLKYMKKIIDQPSIDMKNTIITAAIRNGDETLAWELITNWLRRDQKPSTRLITEFIKHAIRIQIINVRKSELFLERFLAYIQERLIIIDEVVVKFIEEYFRGHPENWEINYSKISRGGKCNSCEKTLDLTDLSAEDFEFLKKSFLERSVMKTDLFINTTKDEFAQYIKFIEARKPFDIVLDGLNTAYASNSEIHMKKKKNHKELSLQLLKVVDHFSAHSLKVLVLGRYHMKRWPLGILEQIQRRATLFFTSNISQEDPFVIYAALASGPESFVVSLDLMRDHIARLDEPKLIKLFKRWQETHQIYMKVDDNDKIKFIRPLQHSINVHGSIKEGYHIPYDDKFDLEPYEELNNWLCIQRTTK